MFEIKLYWDDPRTTHHPLSEAIFWSLVQIPFPKGGYPDPWFIIHRSGDIPYTTGGITHLHPFTNWDVW